MTTRPLRLRITGRVQGVGYRAALAQVATAQGVRGWVRNRPDGSVEAVLSGPADDCDAVIRWARCGPQLARVDDVLVTTDVADADVPIGFDFRPSG